MEGSHSGLVRRSWKPLFSQENREFESLPLRQEMSEVPLGTSDIFLRSRRFRTASSESTSVKRASAVYSSKIAVGYAWIEEHEVFRYLSPSAITIFLNFFSYKIRHFGVILLKCFLKLMVGYELQFFLNFSTFLIFYLLNL